MDKPLTELTPKQFRDLVAEKVMGWKRVKRHTGEWWWQDEAAKVNCCTCKSWEPDRLPIDCLTIVKRMMADGWHLRLSPAGPNGRREAEFSRHGKACKAQGRDEKWAICYAALEASGVGTAEMVVGRQEE